MKILSFGHIPTWAGGLQESGLANVIYQLAKHGSDIDGAEVSLAATDVFVPLLMDGKLIIYGWNKWNLLRYIFAHPYSSVKSYVKLRKLKHRYPLVESSIGLYLKRVFFEKTLKMVLPYIVHLHGTSSIWYLDIVPKDIKVAVTFHGMTGHDRNIAQNDVLSIMEHDLFHSGRVNDFFFICSQLARTFTEVYGNNGKNNFVIFNSYDHSKFFYNENASLPLIHKRQKCYKKKTLCTVASISERKGQLRVLSGLALLPDKNKFHYFCIGTSSDSVAKELKDFACNHDLSFEYLGKMEPNLIREYLYLADYMIMPSSSEGFGLTYLEAIACGTPVILPKNIPITEEKNLINESNSILLDDCSAESIAKVLEHIDSYNFNRCIVANSISGSSWEEISKEYYETFKII